MDTEVAKGKGYIWLVDETTKGILEAQSCSAFGCRLGENTAAT